MLLPFVMALTLTTMAHCDAVGRGIHAINKAHAGDKSRAHCMGRQGLALAPLRFVDALPDTDNLDKLCHTCESSSMATMNVSLPDPMKTWVEAHTKGGRYSNVSDYVRDLIRRDQQRHDAIAEIQTLIDEGVESGAARDFDMATFIRDQTRGPR